MILIFSFSCSTAEGWTGCLTAAAVSGGDRLEVRIWDVLIPYILPRNGTKLWCARKNLTTNHHPWVYFSAVASAAAAVVDNNNQIRGRLVAEQRRRWCRRSGDE